MNHHLKVSLVTVNQKALDISENTRRILRALELCSVSHAEFVCFPELTITSYGCADGFYSFDLLRHVEKATTTIVGHTSSMGVFFGAPIYFEGHLYNAMIFAYRGRIAGIHFKKTLTNTGVHYESRWFTPWPHKKVAQIQYSGQRDIPCGDLIYNIDGLGVGLEICEESWSPYRSLTQQSHYCDLVFNASASHFSVNKHTQRLHLVADSSRLLGSHFFYVNALGVDSGRMIYDGSLIWAFGGEIIAQGPRMLLKDLAIVHLSAPLSDVYKAKLRQKRETAEELSFDGGRSGASWLHRVHLSRHDFAPSPAQINQTKNQQSQKSQKRKVSKEWISHHSISLDPTGHIIEPGENPRNTERSHSTQQTQQDGPRELFLALTLALFDYLRRSSYRGGGYVISVSGGCDSSASACLVVGMIRRGLRELGSEGFLRALGREDLLHARSKTVHHTHLRPQSPNPSPASHTGDSLELSPINHETSPSPKNSPNSMTTENDPVAAIISHLVAGVYQSSRHSSEATRQAARNLCYELGILYYEHPIDTVVDEYVRAFEDQIRRPLSWERDSTLLQNIQARARSPFPWLLANERRAILISTGNRSEAALGYTTMDGDTCGGLAPLGGIGKHDLLSWLQWAHEVGCGDFPGEGRIISLGSVLAMAPTAELCPADWQQTDEDDLMPYEIISHLEKLSVYDKKSTGEIIEALEREFPDIHPQLLAEYHQKFMTLWRSSQWKRERLAPSFHVHNITVDPKGGCRFPILSGPPLFK